MATKKVIEIEVKDNLDKTSKGINDLNKEVKDLTNSADRLDKEFEDVSKTFDEVYGDLKPLTARLGEAEDRLYELALAGKQNTAEYKELLKATANFRQVQIQTDMVVDSAAQTMSQKLGGALQGAASGFSLVQGAMGLVGVESGEIEKALLKVNSAMALAQGVEGVRMAIPVFQGLATTVKTQLVTAFTTLRGAIIATGIGALVVAVGFLLPKIMEWVSSSNTLEKQQNKLNKTLEDQNRILDNNARELSRAQKRQLDLAKASGATDQELLNLRRKQQKDTEKIYDRDVQNLDEAIKKRRNLYISAFVDEDFERAKAINKEIKDLTEQRVEKLRQKRYEREDLKDAQDQLLAQQKQDAKNQLQQDKSYVKEKKEINNQALKDRQELLKLEEEARDKANEYRIKSENDLAERLAQITQSNFDATLSSKELEIRDINDKYFELETLAVNNAVALSEIETAKNRELAIINDKYRAEQEKKDSELDKINDDLLKQQKQKKIQQQLDILQIASSTFSALGALTEAFAGKTEEEQKKAFEVKKAFDIAQAVLDGYKAVMSAYAHGNSIGGPILGGIEAGVAGAFAIAQIRKIEQSTFTPSTPSVGGGGTGGQQQQERIQAPIFNVTGEANQTQQVSDKPVKAYVVSGEVTTQQSLDRNRLRNATL
jgi:hypothetical protein